VVGRQRILRQLLGCDVLVLDELGYLPTTPSFGPAFYELIAGRQSSARRSSPRTRA
jgi:DNA replication protein DnaC